MKVNLPSISGFINSTTTHGFNRIYNSNTVVRFMWLAFVLAALSGLSYHLGQLIINYKSTPVTTSINPGAVPFQAPDIAVCSTSVFSYTASYELMTKSPDIYYSFKDQALWAAYEALTSGIGINDLASTLRIVKSYLDAVKLMYVGGMQREHFIVKCTYKGVSCSFKDFKVFFGATNGRCFQFVPSDSILNLTKDVNEFSLELVVFTDENPTYFDRTTVKYFPQIEPAGVGFDGSYDVTKAGGIILYYAEKGYFPRYYTNLPTGVHSFVDLEMEEYRYLSTLSKPCISEPYFYYYEDPSLKGRLKFKASKTDCHYRKLYEIIQRNCGCTSTDSLPFLSDDEYIEYYLESCQFMNRSNPAYYKTRTNCEKYHIQHKSKLFNQVDCMHNCQERVYTPRVTSVTWPLSSLALANKNALLQDHIDLLKTVNITVPDVFIYLKNNLTTTKDVQQKFVSNFAKISVGASKSFSMLVEETESYPLSSLLSDIGSILGLYIGMSVLSICELFELVLVLAAELRAAFRGYKERIALRTKSQRVRNALVAAATCVQSIDHADD